MQESILERVEAIEKKLANIPERTILDEVERDKDNSRIAELETMVLELRSANFNLAYQLERLDKDITNIAADVKSITCNTVTTVTPEDNFYSYLEMNPNKKD